MLFGCVFLIVFFVTLIKISIDDIYKRSVSHKSLFWLTGLLLLSWGFHFNLSVLPYTLAILVVGFGLFCLGVLGAGDTKLLAVLSLGVSPEFIPLMLYSVALLGGVLALGYLLYGLMTDLTKVREKGIPYAVPISIAGGVFIFLSCFSR
ncbi:prepilin peptidase [Marinomonas sp. 2405UD66-6]|uniref:prepilin peptidase n=1 Tax=Marinomonas sp. 2405UD66-6 TaxID=3391834 RepID=UPI0039C9E7F3